MSSIQWRYRSSHNRSVDELHVIVRESQAQDERRAAAESIRHFRDGRVPGTDDLAKARGAVIRERENSIFSEAWLPIALLLIIIGLLAGRSAPFLAIGIGLIVIFVLSNWWKQASLIGVTYERSFDRNHVFPGERVRMTATISNRKPLPLTWLQFRDEIPFAPDDADGISVLASEITGSYILENTLSLNGFERTQRSVNLRFPSRGFYQLGPVLYLSGDIFTLFTVERLHRYLDTIVVYPRVWPLEELELPAKELFGEIKVRHSLFPDPIKTQGIRDYQPQDRFRDVHWKATAKRNKLQTKVYDPTSGMNVVAFLNVATYPKHWMGFDPKLLERAISVTASITNFAAEQKWGIGVFANGSVPGSDQPIRVPPGRAPGQLVQILEALAAVTEFATASIELLMHRESPSLPWAATLVLVTAVVTEEMLIGLMRLAEAGRRIALISLADDPPPANIRGIQTYHIPSSAPAFQQSGQGDTTTEASLGSVPTPEPVYLEFDEEEDGKKS
ncbi:MAG TPA: DUF58 domain-containing protein [candidate division Zixibacteria bacterium]|nr:DUF58 domain-containing protein [candidate division Zixibacteria bacterium]